jgi:hypothetical protein
MYATTAIWCNGHGGGLRNVRGRYTIRIVAVHVVRKYRTYGDGERAVPGQE